MIPILHPETPDDSGDDAAAGGQGACGQCGSGAGLGFHFAYAYQPIVDVVRGELFAHEALVRGPNGESAHSVLSRVTDANRYRFDQACRVKAIKTAASLGMQTRLSINFLPNAIYRPEVCIRTTLEAARAHNFPIDRIMFETIEGERVADGKWYAEVLREYQRIGFLTAIDDFGAGFAGLNLLADFQPDIVKLDMDLVRDIDQRRSAQSIVRGVSRICEELGIAIIAEGIETMDEYHCLHSFGIQLMQGYLFAKPQFGACVSAESFVWPSGTYGAKTETQADGCPDDPFGGMKPVI